MYKKRILPIALAVLVATGTAGGFAIAQERGQPGRNEASLTTTAVTLQQAIATAEQQAGGRAVSADIERERGATQIEVKVAGPQSVKTVVVDAQSGQVTATRAGDQDDQDDKDND